MPPELALLDRAAIALAVLAAGTMGFAIQRGGTCMVAAVNEAVTRRRANRLLALGESGLWVSGLFAFATLAGLLAPPAMTYPAGLAALTGGVLLGLGALANGACVFGAVARIGSRDWHFLLTPVGFYFGSLAHARLALPMGEPIPYSVNEAGGWLLLALFLPLLFYRLFELATAHRSEGLAARLWHPHRATIVIGVAFVVLALAAGPWTYPESLYRAAHTGKLPFPSDIMLFLALLGGAVIGGLGRGETIGWKPQRAVTCLAGGALMGLGSAMIPGGNDNLSLVGIPMRHAYAWLAIAAMAAAIWAGIIVKARLRAWARPTYIGDIPSG
jgi:hypothetical protein